MMLKKMKNILEKIIFCENASDLVQKTLVVISVVYLALFSLEAVVPGIVIEVFNFNILLFFIILAIFYGSVYSQKNKDAEKLMLKKVLSKSIIFLMATVIILSIVFVQYKIPLWEGLVYLFFSIVVARLIFKMI